MIQDDKDKILLVIVIVIYLFHQKLYKINYKYNIKYNILTKGTPVRGTESYRDWRPIGKRLVLK